MSNKDDEERFRNFILFKAFLTDKEIEEIMPFMGIATLIALFVLGIIILVVECF